MRRVKRWAQLSILAFVTAFGLVAVAPAAISMAAPDCNNGGNFLTFKPWYNGLEKYDTTTGSCVIISPSTSDKNEQTSLSNFIWHIVLNVLAILVQVVGYLAVIMVIYGGFQFLTGGDNPTQVTKARTTILNAVIGLVIAISATAVINLVVTNLIGSSSVDPTTGLPTQSATNLWAGALNLIYYVAGAVAIIMMILAGFRYITANGDSNAVGKAKNQILYGVVGLVIIMVAFAITDFVIGRIKG